jgi:hypothetical protein
VLRPRAPAALQALPRCRSRPAAATAPAAPCPVLCVVRSAGTHDTGGGGGAPPPKHTHSTLRVSAVQWATHPRIYSAHARSCAKRWRNHWPS